MPHFDLVIFGGGTVGTAIFLDAQLRGLKTVLIERKKVGRQTNAASLGLLQGGLKYLASDRDLITMDSADCLLLSKIVPHLVRKQPMLIPVYPNSRFSLWQWDILLSAYDDFASARGVELHRMLSPTETYSDEPLLRKGALGSALFYERSVDPVRLVQELTRAALGLGGTLFEQTLIERFTKSRHGKIAEIESVTVRNNLGLSTEISGSHFINATGPWAAKFPLLLGLPVIKSRPTRGTSIVINNRLTTKALITFNRDKKYIAILPLNDKQTLIGPTNYDVEPEVANNPDKLCHQEFEIAELLEAANNLLGIPLDRTNVAEIRCGLRPQLNHRKVGPDKISHEFIIVDHGQRDGLSKLKTIFGGKLSNPFRMAKEVMDLITDKPWQVPAIEILQDGKIIRNNCDQDCSTYLHYQKTYALNHKNNIGRVAMQKSISALCSLAPFIVKAGINKLLQRRPHAS